MPALSKINSKRTFVRINVESNCIYLAAKQIVIYGIAHWMLVDFIRWPVFVRPRKCRRARQCGEMHCDVACERVTVAQRTQLLIFTSKSTQLCWIRVWHIYRLDEVHRPIERRLPAIYKRIWVARALAPLRVGRWHEHFAVAIIATAFSVYSGICNWFLPDYSWRIDSARDAWLPVILSCNVCGHSSHGNDQRWHRR